MTDRQSHSAHPTIAPFQAFPTSDGWIVAGGSKEKFWKLMGAAIGRQDMLVDPRFESFATRRQYRREFVGEPCSALNTVEEALAEPHAFARGSVVETTHPKFGLVRSMASAVRVGEPMTDHRSAPALGEHTRSVLTELCGYSSEKIDGLIKV